MNFELKSRRLLVTGGAGFIGSALCEAFLKQDNEVVCLDNLLTGHRENIAPFLSNPRFTFIEGDIRDPETCKKACDGVDYVFHQAALGSVPRSIENPSRTNEINITGMLNMLVAARDAKVRRFVYASSSSVYGSSKKLPKVEEETGEPLSPYAVTKVVNEKYARVFHEIYGLETTGLRYFNVFGRRQDPYGAYAAVIPKWVARLMKHERPVINGDGSYSRDFTYIDNVVHANEVAAAPTPKSPPPIGGGDSEGRGLLGSSTSPMALTPPSTSCSASFAITCRSSTRQSLKLNLFTLPNAPEISPTPTLPLKKQKNTWDMTRSSMPGKVLNWPANGTTSTSGDEC